jgi:hypothetical protein
MKGLEDIIAHMQSLPEDNLEGVEILDAATCGPGAPRWGHKWSESEREAHKDNPFFTKESSSAAGKKGGKTTRENKKGIFDPNYDRTPAAIKAGKASTGGSATYNKGKGLFDPKNAAKMKEGRSKVHKQMYQCILTGYISNACGLSNYQKGKGINYKDKSLRIKVSNL